ncbi:MAG: YIP1 family protein [Fervidobacterium sp.]
MKTKRIYKKEVEKTEEPAEKVGLTKSLKTIVDMMINPAEAIKSNKNLETKNVIVNSAFIIAGFIILISILEMIFSFSFNVVTLIGIIIFAFILGIIYPLIFSGVSTIYWFLLAILGVKTNFQEQTKNTIIALTGLIIITNIFGIFQGIGEYIALIAFAYYLYVLYVIVKETNETTSGNAIITVLIPIIILLILLLNEAFMANAVQQI